MGGVAFSSWVVLFLLQVKWWCCYVPPPLLECCCLALPLLRNDVVFIPLLWVMLPSSSPVWGVLLSFSLLLRGAAFLRLLGVVAAVLFFFIMT